MLWTLAERQPVVVDLDHQSIIAAGKLGGPRSQHVMPRSFSERLGRASETAGSSGCKHRHGVSFPDWRLASSPPRRALNAHSGRSGVFSVHPRRRHGHPPAGRCCRCEPGQRWPGGDPYFPRRHRPARGPAPGSFPFRSWVGARGRRGVSLCRLAWPAAGPLRGYGGTRRRLNSRPVTRQTLTRPSEAAHQPPRMRPRRPVRRWKEGQASAVPGLTLGGTCHSRRRDALMTANFCRQLGTRGDIQLGEHVCEMRLYRPA